MTGTPWVWRFYGSPLGQIREIPDGRLGKSGASSPKGEQFPDRECTVSRYSDLTLWICGVSGGLHTYPPVQYWND